MPTVQFDGREIECERGAVLRDVLRAAGLSPHNGATERLNCGGRSTCGTCAVVVDGPVSEPTTRERIRTTLPPLRGSEVRLACQTRVEGDVTVRKPLGIWGERELVDPTPVTLDEPDASDWTTARATAANAGTTHTGDVPVEPEHRWESSTNGPVGGAVPAGGERVVYAVSGAGVVYAFDARSGDRRWRAKTLRDDAEQPPTPTVAGGTVFVAANDLHAFDASTGRRAWQASVPGGAVAAAPAVRGNVVLAPGSDGRLAAFDTVTGIERWTAEIATGLGLATGAPKPVGDVAIVTTDRGDVAVVDLTTGDRHWRTTLSGGTEPETPAVAEGTLLVRTATALVALDPATGERVWRFDPPATLSTSPTVDGERAFVGTTTGELIALDRRAGEPAWSRTIGDGPVREPAVAGGTVYVGAAKTLRAVTARDGTERWSLDLPTRIDGELTLGDGLLYFGTDHGAVQAVGRPSDGDSGGEAGRTDGDPGNADGRTDGDGTAADDGRAE